MNNQSTGLTEPSYPREIFEPIITPAVELETLPSREVSLCFHNLDGSHELQTCYGDIRKIVDALMDYTAILETVCDQWNLQGFHRAIYGLHANKLREIAEKYQAGIDYDYYAALVKCRKKQQRQKRHDDIGEDALVLASRKNRTIGKKQVRPSFQTPPVQKAVPGQAEMAAPQKKEVTPDGTP